VCNDVLWNGFVWVAVGQGTNTIAYSTDGIVWTGLGTTIFSAAGNRLLSNGSIILATGSGTNAIAYSYDGVIWTGLGTAMFGSSPTAVNGLAWNGSIWMAGSAGATNTVAYSANGINWTAITNSTSLMTTNCNALLWTGAQWIAAGTSSTTSVLSVSSNNGQSWSINSMSGLTTGFTVTGMSMNRNRIVAIGYSATATNTLAYSTDVYGTAWVGLGTTLFANASNVFAKVKWAINKFVAFSTDTTNRIAYSYDGITWYASSTANAIFTTAAFGGDCATAQPHKIVFPTNAVIAGNIVSRDNGNSWTTYSNIAAPNSIGWNGSQYIFGASSGNNSYLAYDLSGTIIQIPLTNLSQVNVIKWNGSQWLTGGVCSSVSALITSFDGFTWTPVAQTVNVAGSPMNIMAPLVAVNGISWNNSSWVVSGVSATGISMMLYSNDLVNWTQTSSTLGGGQVEWNGSFFLVTSGPIQNQSSAFTSNQNDPWIAISQNGVIWTGINLAPNSNSGPVQSIVWNGKIWAVSTVNPSNVPGIYVSYDSYTWTAVGGGQTFSNLGIEWGGVSFIVNTNSANVRYSYDGTTWTTTTIPAQNGSFIKWNNSNVGTMNIQQPTIVGGQGSVNNMSYSLDGVFYCALGSSIFSNSCNAVAWNGQLWMAGGSGNVHTLAYSFDGLKWIGLGNTVFQTQCNSLTWNGSIWLAMGSGGNTMATSPTGIAWTGIPANSVFGISGLCAEWNGNIWLAGGTDLANTMATTNDPYAVNNWQGLGNATFGVSTNTVRWIAQQWIAGGQGNVPGAGGNVFAYTTDSTALTNWTASATQIFGASANQIVWNGRIVVAVGTCIANTIAVSTNYGVSWVGLGSNVFAGNAFGLAWNTQRWIAAGTNVAGNVAAYSYDGSNWYSAKNINNTMTAGYAVGTNSRMGAITVNSGIYANTNDRLTITTPKYYDDSISSDTAISINLNLPQV